MEMLTRYAAVPISLLIPESVHERTRMMHMNIMPDAPSIQISRHFWNEKIFSLTQSPVSTNEATRKPEATPVRITEPGTLVCHKPLIVR